MRIFSFMEECNQKFSNYGRMLVLIFWLRLKTSVFVYKTTTCRRKVGTTRIFLSD